MKPKQGVCYCGNKTTKWKMGAWCCDRCDKCESMMKSDLGALAGFGIRVKYSEFDFRGRLFSR